MDADRLGWYRKRLTTMTAAEVRWRAGRAVSGMTAARSDRRARRALPVDEAAWQAWLDAFREGRDRVVLLDRGHAASVLAACPEDAARVVGLAEAVLEGRMSLLGYAEAHLASPPDWHHDVLADHHWPGRAAQRIDHRTSSADPKWIWELNRLQHLPWLAQAWLFTGREEFAACFFEHLDSWVEQNPVGQGIAWRGAFEAGVRAISVLVALQGLRDSPLLTTERFRAVVEVLEASARRCWTDRSRFSSANNHLVGELSGLATIGLLLPELPGARTWVRRGVAELGAQADLQVLPDGAGAEQSISYQLFTVEFLLLVRVLVGSADLDGARQLEAAVSRSDRFLRDVVHDGEPSPRYGDDDQGFVLRLGPEPVRTVAGHLALVSAAAGADEPRDLTSAWLAAGAAHRGLRADGAPRDSTYAPAGGLVVIRRGPQRITVDVGPLGYTALAAHGHADALALTLAVGGRALLDDPGTGSYYGHPEWREAFRSTRAHATVTVDDEDQSVIAGPFMWSEHAQVLVHEVDLDAGVVDAEHDGYERLAQPVTHRRRLEAPTADGFVAVDVVRGDGTHRVAVSWPLAPDLTARPDPSGHVVSRDGSDLIQVAVAATVPVSHRQVVGDETSELGWWSDRLETRRPSYLLRSEAQGPVPVVLATVARRVAADGTLPVRDLRVEVVGDEARVSWSEHGKPASTTLDVSRTQGAGPH